MSGSTTLPIVITAAGLQPQSPVSLNAQIIAGATALSPGLTANLPGSLIEDVASTATYAAVVCDQARVELINSLTPYGANEQLLVQIGVLKGLAPQGSPTNTTVNVVIGGPPGYVIAPGFVVSDGSNQYVIPDGGVIGANSETTPLFAVAEGGGSFPVPAGTVTTIAVSIPASVQPPLQVTNPSPGVPGSIVTETVAQYRARLFQAEAAAAIGTPDYLKGRLLAIPGVQARLVAMRQIVGGGWQILCGGGDIYAVGGAIYRSVPDISILQGSAIVVSGITTANPGVVTTSLIHGYTTGESVVITGVVGMTGINGVVQTITALSPTTFSIADTSNDGTYVSGGKLSPDNRTAIVSIADYPDTYTIPFVLPPQQVVNVTLTWNTSAPNFVLSAAVNALGSQAVQNYVNALPAGQPMILYDFEGAFKAAVAGVIPTGTLSRMVFAVSINGVGIAPVPGTGIIAGDPEGYFLCGPSSVQVVQG